MSSTLDPGVPPPSIGALLRLAWNSFRRRMFEAVRAAGYDDLQPVHVSLFRYPTIAGRRPGQLAEEAGLSKQAINDLLRQLEAMGYITLDPDPTDRRARRIVLTQRGSEVMECVRTAAALIAEDWARAVGGERLEVVRRTLLDCIEADRAGT
jgi:DNA-binding MarR family transcriptional regulator